MIYKFIKLHIFVTNFYKNYRISMEKTNLIQEFKNRVGEDNHEFISDQTFDAMAAVYLPRFAEDDKITDDTWKEPIEALKNFAGQTKSSRMKFAQDFEAQNKEKQQKAIDDAVAAAKAEWEKTNGKGGDGEGNGGKGGKGGDGDGENDATSKAVAKALNDYNEKLFGKDGKSGLIGGQLNQTAEFIKAQTKSQEQAKLSEIGKALKEFLTGEKANKEFAVNLAVKNICGGIEDIAKADIDALKLSVKKEYEQIYLEAYGNSAKPFGGNSAGGEDESGIDEEVRKYLDEKAKQDSELEEKKKTVKSGLK